MNHWQDVDDYTRGLECDFTCKHEISADTYPAAQPCSHSSECSEVAHLHWTHVAHA